MARPEPAFKRSYRIHQKDSALWAAIGRNRKVGDVLGLRAVDRKKLVQAFESLKALPLPPTPDSGELDEWRADLIEMDGFYAGVASTVLGGGSIEHYLQDLDVLASTLRSIQPRTGGIRRVATRAALT